MLLGGSVGFYAQTVWLTWKEAEAIEATFRAAYNRTFQRAGSSARAPLYAEAAGGRKALRRHVQAVAAGALLAAVEECMAEPTATPARGAARAAVAMAMCKWGCRGAPEMWTWEHIRTALEEHLQRSKVRLMGEGFMMAILMARPGGKAPWVRWLTLPVEGDAMCDTAAHFADSWTRKVFEPKEAGGYGLEPASELLAAGLVAQGHFCCEGDNGEWRWMESVEEAAKAQGFEVNKMTAEQWRRTVDALQKRGEPC